jgi:hypothetical protein
MISPGIIEALERIDGDVWTEVSLHMNADINRRLRIALKHGLVIDTDAIRERYRAYRLSPKGMATLDLYKLERRARGK